MNEKETRLKKLNSGKGLRLSAITVTMLAFAIIIMTTASAAAGSLTFSNTPLIRSEGDSEPAIAIASDGTMAISGLQWLFEPNFGTHLWTGSFGSTPTFQGLLDAGMQLPGKQVFGSADADIDIGSTNTLHATTLLVFFNPVFVGPPQIGVSAISCPDVTSGSFSINNCNRQIIDTTTSDRPWITSDGQHVYISYHDSANSVLIHVQRSDDDGLTWHRVGDPLVGQGATTGSATFNNVQGPIVADSFTGNVYAIYAAGEAGIQKAKTSTYNNIFVSRSTDMGKSWKANLVFHAPIFTSLNNFFPALTVDPTNGKLYAAWSDAHGVFFSTSSDQGSHWTNAMQVNIAPANTAVLPWVSAYSGTVDVVYYGTTAASKDDSSAVWNVYMAQTFDDGASFTQNLASNTPNHVGVICTFGTGCASGTRNLLDLFKVAVDPQNGHAGIIYTDDTLTKTNDGSPLPQIVLAQQQ